MNLSTIARVNQLPVHNCDFSSQPLISVLMPAYNSEKYIALAIDSILKQSYNHFELIIIDDGSSDQTLAIIQKYAKKDDRIRIISRANTGIVGALNDGLQIARGNLIARMDADDISFPERFAKQVAFLTANSGHVAVGCSMIYIDPDGISFKTFSPPIAHVDIETRHLHGQGGGIMHPCVMMKREAVISIGSYRFKYQNAEDYDLFLRLGEIGKLANLPDILFYYRVHLGSITYAKHREMMEKTREALYETCQRRGIKMKELSNNPYRASNPAGTTSFWSIQALLDNRFLNAVHLALKAVRKFPSHRQPWIALAFSLLGPCGKYLYLYCTK